MFHRWMDMTSPWWHTRKRCTTSRNLPCWNSWLRGKACRKLVKLWKVWNREFTLFNNFFNCDFSFQNYFYTEIFSCHIPCALMLLYPLFYVYYCFYAVYWCFLSTIFTYIFIICALPNLNIDFGEICQLSKSNLGSGVSKIQFTNGKVFQSLKTVYRQEK